MFHISKQNVAVRMQVKRLLNGNSLEIIWFSFLLTIMNNLFRKPVLNRKSLFQFSGTGFLLFLFFFHRKLAIQKCFCKVAGENGKKLLTEALLSIRKGISHMHIFTILQLSRSVGLRRKLFLGENEERIATLLQETQGNPVS